MTTIPKPLLQLFICLLFSCGFIRCKTDHIVHPYVNSDSLKVAGSAGGTNEAYFSMDTSYYLKKGTISVKLKDTTFTFDASKDKILVRVGPVGGGEIRIEVNATAADNMHKLMDGLSTYGNKYQDGSDVISQYQTNSSNHYEYDTWINKKAVLKIKQITEGDRILIGDLNEDVYKGYPDLFYDHITTYPMAVHFDLYKN